MITDQKINKNFFDKTFFNKVLIESDNFSVIPSLGSLLEGWVLIVPKKHYISLGAINDSSLFAELELLTNDVTDFLTKEYGNVTIFEHGSVEPKTQVGCGVDYAHLHLVPLSINLIEKAEKYFGVNYEWRKCASYETMGIYFQKKLPYLYIKENLNISYIATNDSIPSQLFRKVIANDLGLIEKYDWKNNFFLENVNKTISKFSKYEKNKMEKQL